MRNQFAILWLDFFASNGLFFGVIFAIQIPFQDVALKRKKSLLNFLGCQFNSPPTCESPGHTLGWDQPTLPTEKV